MNDIMSKRRSVAILIRDNHDNGFRFMKQGLTAEDFGAVINLEESGITISAFSEFIISADDSMFSSFLAKLDAKTQYGISICIGEDDQEYTAELKTAKAVYTKLQNKYKEKLQTTDRQYMIDLINYKKLADKTIDEIGTEITKLIRKVCAIRPEFKILTTQKKRFATLLRFLSEEYDNVRDYIDSQDNPDVDTAIQKL